MKYKFYIILFLCSFNVLAQQIVPSNNRSIAGLEKNMLFNAKSRFTVTQTGTATLDLPTLFDGKMAPSYTNTAPSVSNPTVVVIEDLLNLHVQAGAWIGWTTRYWAPKTFKIEGYNAYDNANTWVTIADVTNYPNFDYIQAVPSGSYTKLRFTFYEGTGTNGLLGISELFFLHPEAVAAYDGLSVQYNSNSNAGVGTVNTTGARLEVKGEFTPAYAQMALVGKTEGSGIGISFNEPSLNRRGIIYTANGEGLILGEDTGYGIRMFSSGVEVLTARNNGNIGIGITNPKSSLHLSGSNKEIRFDYNGTDNYFGSLRWAGLQLGNNGENRIIAGRNNTGGSLSFYVNNTNDAANYTQAPDGIHAMKIASSGNIGIGTTNPLYPLHVTGGAAMPTGWNKTLTLQSTYPVILFNSNNQKWAGVGYDFSDGGMRFWVNKSSDNLNSSAPALSILNNGNSWFNGNIGVGTENPLTPLHILGNTTLQGNSGTNYVPSILFKRTEGANMYSIGPKNATLTNSNFDINSVNGNPITFSTESIERLTLLNNGNVGIGTPNPTKKLEIGGLRSMTFDSNLGLIKMKADAGGWAMNYGFTGSTGADLGGFWGYGGANELVQWSIGKAYTDNFLVVKNNGQVTIGTPTPYSDYKLAVAGNVIADKVKVKKSTNGTWPDFVFSPSYKLPTLIEVESFVKQNSHLPEIPSASEIEKDGQDLGEMNRLLLKKVEELTLYLIEQNKEIKSLKSKVELLENK